MDTVLATLVAAVGVFAFEWTVRWLLGFLSMERAEPLRQPNGCSASTDNIMRDDLRVASKSSSAETVFVSHELVWMRPRAWVDNFNTQ
jgi:hypothetical protein